MAAACALTTVINSYRHRKLTKRSRAEQWQLAVEYDLLFTNVESKLTLAECVVVCRLFLYLLAPQFNNTSLKHGIRHLTVDFVTVTKRTLLVIIRPCRDYSFEILGPQVVRRLLPMQRGPCQRNRRRAIVREP